MSSHIKARQIECCTHYQAPYLAIKDKQLVVISKGVYEGVVPIEGVRYPSPEHMSGWWLTTDEYSGDINTLLTVHYSHLVEKRPEIAIYMALPTGYRFNLGGENEHVWFDQDVANERI